MRVFVVETLGKGGLIHYSFHMCRGLQRAGAEATLITSTDYELDDLPHEFTLNKFLHLWDPRQAKPANPIQRKLQRATRGLKYLYQWWRLTRYLKRERPDVILLGEMRFAFEAYFLKQLKNDGLILADIVHDVRAYELNPNSDSIVKESESHQRQYNQLYNLFAALFVHDKSNRDLFLELYDVPAERVHQIVHPTSELMLEVAQAYTPEGLRAHLGIDPARPVALFFGTLTKYKGVEDLVRALPLIIAQCSITPQLVIAGFPAKDIDPAELKALAQSLGVAEHIIWFLDYVPNEWVATLMNISDVLVLPYRAITQSGILQIAYACAKPVVGTRVGGLPDTIIEGQSGLLAEPNDPASLAKATARLLNNPEEAAKMGAYAKQLADTRYSWLAVATQIKGIFETLKPR